MPIANATAQAQSAQSEQGQLPFAATGLLKGLKAWDNPNGTVITGLLCNQTKLQNGTKADLPPIRVRFRSEHNELLEAINDADWALVRVEGYLGGSGQIGENEAGYASFPRFQIYVRRLEVIKSSAMGDRSALAPF
jgi:hypothetical protein